MMQTYWPGWVPRLLSWLNALRRDNQRRGPLTLPLTTFLLRPVGELTGGLAVSVSTQGTFDGRTDGRRVVVLRLREALGRVARATPRR
jgi:hypothetical protein